MSEKLKEFIEIAWGELKDRLEREAVQAIYHGRFNAEKAARQNLLDFEQVYQQILHLIESHGEHDEEFVDKEARNFLHSIQDIQYPFQLIKTKNFIRSLLSKVQKKAVCIFCALPINDDEGACKSCANQALKDLSKKPVVDKNWLPTAKNINALPEPVRHYIAKLETNCDPPSMVQENIILRETCKALEMMKKPRVSRELIDKIIAEISYETGHKYRVNKAVEMFIEADVEVEE